jgi:gamma-glutamylcyclotransferase
MILFAYASNMNVAEFATHVTSARKLSNAYLPGYLFVFNKIGHDGSAKANVEPTDELDAKVWGVLIDISEEDRLHVFNPADDWTEHLELLPLSCIGTDGETYTAQVFISKPHAINNSLLPYDWYQEKLATFALWQDLPVEYISSLNTMKSKVDPDVRRRERQLSKYRR